MKEDSIQPAARIPRAAWRVLLEALFVAALGVVFAFAANRISPHGLVLARNYFPTGTNNTVRAAIVIVPTNNITSTNVQVPFGAQQLAEKMKNAGLQLINRNQALQLFHSSRSEQGIVFIDARAKSDYQQGHIPGAYEFDPYHPEEYFPVALPPCQTAQKIVVYCEGGDCDDSETAALLLKDVGIPGKKIFVYAGGMTEWTNNRLPIETGARNSGILHNVNQ